MSQITLHTLLGDDDPNTLPEVASISSTALPRVSIHQREVILQPRLGVYSRIAAADRCDRDFGAAGLIEVDLVRGIDCEWRPICDRFT